eukprot:1795303-Alexandrium_andersonii.AAC.1
MSGGEVVSVRGKGGGQVRDGRRLGNEAVAVEGDDRAVAGDWRWEPRRVGKWGVMTVVVVAASDRGGRMDGEVRGGERGSTVSGGRAGGRGGGRGRAGGGPGEGGRGGATADREAKHARRSAPRAGTVREGDK